MVAYFFWGSFCTNCNLLSVINKKKMLVVRFWGALGASGSGGRVAKWIMEVESRSFDLRVTGTSQGYHGQDRHI